MLSSGSPVFLIIQEEYSGRHYSALPEMRDDIFFRSASDVYVPNYYIFLLVKVPFSYFVIITTSKWCGSGLKVREAS